MSNQLVISSIDLGLQKDVEPFLLDNEAFPVLKNAYVWRKRILRKRGNSFLGRLQRDLMDQSVSTTDGIGIFLGNIFFLLGLDVIAPNASLRVGNLIITVGPQTFIEETDPFTGILIGDMGGTGTINYQTSLLTLIDADPTTPIIAAFSYFPNLPVMGLESFESEDINFPSLVSFDTRYSYEIDQNTDLFFDVNFFKMTGTPFTWAGQDFQQFWTANYEGAMFTTNNNPGFHFATITVLDDVTSTDVPMTLNVNFLQLGDLLFFNEILGTDIQNINERVGEITDSPGGSVYTVTFESAVTIDGWDGTSGIAQVLTRDVVPNADGIRWYDGDNNADTTKGWVNFAPPLQAFDPDTSPNPDYLIGAQAIIPFKGRLLFLNVVVAQFVSHGNYNPVRFKNRVVYSQDGGPFYTVDNTDEPFPSLGPPVLVPTNAKADPQSWAANRAGRGGFIGAPITQSLVTASENEDVLIVGFESRQLKLVFTGDDSFPFIFQTIDSELGSQSTFSAVNLDKGILSFGEYGFAMTTQYAAERFDLQIPDEVFTIRRGDSDDNRVTAIRNFRMEWIYFTYCPNDNTRVYPSKTLIFNYRNNTWATFDENFTTYGTFRRNQFVSWSMLGDKYGTWSAWNDPWNFGSTSTQYPNIVGGNQHGFVMIKDSGTFEAKSEYIQAIELIPDTDPVITSPDHGLESNEFIEILDTIGIDNINNQIFKISVDETNLDEFILLLDDNQLDTPPTGDYIGNGTFRRISKPDIQTKQFPLFWDQGKQIRVGTQKYLFQTTTDGEITSNILMSQADNFPVNDPDNSSYGIYSQIILTSPEPESRYPPDPNQMWHRMSSSFIGDTFQIGFTLSDDQMRDNNINSAEIILYSMIFDVYPGPILA